MRALLETMDRRNRSFDRPFDRPCNPRPRRGVTLVEIVVVIGLIAVMMGLLMPAVSNARATGRTTACMSNLRQMALAAQQYAALYQAWPAAVRYERVDGTLRTIAWDWVTSAGAPATPGALWAFGNNPDRVQQCPDYAGPSNFSGDPFTGYNYNTSYVGTEARFPSSWDNSRPGIRPHACSRGSTCAVFGDGGWSRGANKFMRAPSRDREAPPFGIDELYAGGQAFRHLGATNVAYLDGHVAPAHTAYKGDHATTERLTLMGYPRNGFLSDDDTAYDPR